jgi:hypothetical protein
MHKRHKELYKILVGNLKGRDHFRDPYTEETILLIWNVKEIGRQGMCWNQLAQNRNHWQALGAKVLCLQASNSLKI